MPAVMTSALLTGFQVETLQINLNDTLRPRSRPRSASLVFQVAMINEILIILFKGFLKIDSLNEIYALSDNN
jgi:hypothetical protein